MCFNEQIRNIKCPILLSHPWYMLTHKQYIINSFVCKILTAVRLHRNIRCPFQHIQDFNGKILSSISVYTRLPIKKFPPGICSTLSDKVETFRGVVLRRGNPPPPPSPTCMSFHRCVTVALIISIL